MATMKKWIGVILVVGLLLLAGSFILAAQGSTTYIYEGKEVFRTDQDYELFKEAVGVSEVTIWEMFILSSASPIVVDYQIDAPKSLDFSYGERELLPSSTLFGCLFALGIIATSVGGGLFIYQILKKVNSGI